MDFGDGNRPSPGRTSVLRANMAMFQAMHRVIYRLDCFLLGREKLVSRPLRPLGLGMASLSEPSERQLVVL